MLGGLEEGDWQRAAACRGKPTDWFFPGPYYMPEIAKQICEGCSVKEQCLEWALSTGMNEGVCGGMTEDERRLYRKKRGR